MHQDETTPPPAQRPRDEDNFGQRIRARRLQADLTQRELAAELKAMGLNIDASAITRMETGERAVKINEAQAIARALRTTVGTLLDEQGEMPISYVRSRANHHMHGARRHLAAMLQDMATVQVALREDPRNLTVFADDANPPSKPDDYLPWVHSRLKGLTSNWMAASAQTAEDAAVLRKIASSLVARVVEVDPGLFDFDEDAEWESAGDE